MLQSLLSTYAIINTSQAQGDSHYWTAEALGAKLVPKEDLPAHCARVSSGEEPWCPVMQAPVR